MTFGHMYTHHAGDVDITFPVQIIAFMAAKILARPSIQLVVIKVSPAVF
jgi:hypothetical protein